MSDEHKLLTLIAVFAPLSLVSIGGGPAIIAEMQHQAVTVQGWMTQREFADLFAISRAAPGPGRAPGDADRLARGRLAGGARGLARVLPAKLDPGVRHRACVEPWRGTRLHGAIETGFAPIAVGLCSPACWRSSRGTPSVLAWGVALAVAAGRIVAAEPQSAPPARARRGRVRAGAGGGLVCVFT